MKKINKKSDTMKSIEDKWNMEIEEILRQLFVDEDKTNQQMLDELSISYVTLFKWLKRAGIYSRKLNI